MKSQKPRQIAIRLLHPQAGDQGFIEDRLEQAFHDYALSEADRRLVQELVYGVTRRRRILAWMLQQKVQTKIPNPLVSNILYLGLYQLFFLDRIPDHAAVFETVDLTRQMGFVSKAGFVNAVMRGYVREKEATRKQLTALEKDQPALALSHPDWLAERWRSRWGWDQTLALMAWNNHSPKTFARLNTLRARADQLLLAWQQEGVTCVPVQKDWIPAGLCYELASHPPLASLKSFQQGWFYIQDPSTLLAVSMLAPQPGEQVLDMCAAPGGKTGYLAQQMENRGQLTAWDIEVRRLGALRENLHRLGVTCATVAGTQSAQTLGPEPIYDRVLVDAPCSNTGVMRRRVDLRWRIDPRELQRLPAEQLEILCHASRYVKPGGRLVYSTCSLEPEENQEVIQRFLTEHPTWSRVGQRELTPFQDGVDGAFVAALSPQIV